MQNEGPVPQEVAELMGNTMSQTALLRWWFTQHEILGGLSPATTWAIDKEKVRNLILGAKGGDMA